MHNTNRLAKEDEIAIEVVINNYCSFRLWEKNITASQETRVMLRNADWPTWPTFGQSGLLLNKYTS